MIYNLENLIYNSYSNNIIYIYIIRTNIIILTTFYLRPTTRINPN